MRTQNPLPKAVQDCHELIVWLIPQLDKFPRNRRFTLGERIETGTLEILELLVAAAYSSNKAGCIAGGLLKDRYKLEQMASGFMSK